MWSNIKPNFALFTAMKFMGEWKKCLSLDFKFSHCPTSDILLVQGLCARCKIAYVLAVRFFRGNFVAVFSQRSDLHQIWERNRPITETLNVAFRFSTVGLFRSFCASKPNLAQNLALSDPLQKFGEVWTRNLTPYLSSL